MPTGVRARLTNADEKSNRSGRKPVLPVVIMAGGEGVRIGGSKPMQNVAGVPMISRALEFARRHSPYVAVSVRAAEQLVDVSGTAILLDPMPGQGPLNSLLSAFAYCQKFECSHVLVIGCDMPLLPDDLVSRLSAGMIGHSAVIARSAGRLHLAAGLWKVETKQLDRYVETGRRSLIGYASFAGYTAVDWDTALFDPFFNVNTLEDVAAAERILRKAAL